MSSNCVELFLQQSQEHPLRPAIWETTGRSLSFGDLAITAAAMQADLRAAGIGPGDEVLLFGRLGSRLYAAVIAILASGATVLFVEPWMPLARIEHIVAARRPRAFVTDWLGRLWALRCRAIRAIPRWLGLRPAVSAADVAQRSLTALNIVAVPAEQAGIITFTSGSTGRPKGVVRPHGYLNASLQILANNLHLRPDPSQTSCADLCIFANFTLANLGLGKPTLLLGSDWSARTLRRVADLNGELAPSTLTCGPAFLESLLQSGVELASLRHIHVGGALTDCTLIERALKRWPQAEIAHIYGSTEAEPVALGSAREAVARSRAAGYQHMLWLGHPIPEISIQLADDNTGLWVSGPNVCPAYVMADASEAKNKRLDAQGRLWHAMGDRIRRDADGSLWYAGRSNQDAALFALEEKLYAATQCSDGFVHLSANGRKVLVAARHSPLTRLACADYNLDQVVSVTKIHRDLRHRARIDRGTTLKKEAAWLLD